ncbi:mannosyl-oligosaccharide alpha-1,2-mannosidase, partial [Linnemannia zychae]
MDTTRGLKSTKAATSKLLPTHRFCTTIARHTLPFYAVPLHYLKRRGVISVLLCMGGIAFLHSAYLFPSTSNHFSDDMFYSSNSNIRDVKNSFFSLERIREQPSFGSAPINGIDENGFEIIEDPFAENIFMKDKVKEPSAHSKATILHEQEVQHGHSQPSRIQFKFEDSALHQTEERLDLLKARRTFVKGMIQHAWSGFLSKTMTPSSSDNQLVNRKNTRLFQIRTQWIDIMDTLLLTSMTEEYNFAKAKVLDTTKVISQNIHSWQQKSQVEKQASTRQQEQHQTQAHIQEQQSQENISEETNDTDQHGIGFYETVVRQLGGLLSICELERSQTPTNENLKLVNMAIDLGDLLALAFQGPNNALPASIIFESGRIGSNKILAGKVSLAEVSTFQLEFRQLSYLSSNIKYKELADNNINYLAALNLKVPGLYPAYFNPKYGVSHEYVASFGSLSDGFYEYLLKTYMLTENVKFKDLYIASIEAMYKHLISRSQKSSSPHLVLGVYDTATDILVPKMDHL